MASTIVEILELPEGLTASIRIYSADTIQNGASGDTLTERTNAKGQYTATVTEALAGVYTYRCVDANNVTLSSGMLDLVDDTGTYYGYDPAVSANHANLQDAVDNYSAERGLAGTALPAAAADAAGGLPISDAGGLDLDTLLDAAISSRMATYTQPTGFLAATFPTTVASTTNITGGTITTVTNVTNLPAAAQASIDAIEADTNELQTDWVNGGRLDLILDIIATDTTTDIPALIATAQADLDTITGSDGVTLATTQGNYAPATAAALATAKTDLDTITGTSGVLIATGQTAAAWSSLEASAGQIIEATVDTVTNTHTPTTTEFQADDVTEATADHYNGRIVIFTSGVLAGQGTSITDYEAVGGIGQFTVTALTEAPSDNDTFIIL